MRVLLITDNHTPTGGAENYFFDLKSRLKKISNLEVFSLGFGENSENGTDFIVYPRIKSNSLNLLARIVPNIIFQRKLRNDIAKINPDIIHLHNIKQHTAALLNAIKPYPVIQTVHDYSNVCPTAQNIHKNFQVCETGFTWKCFSQHHTKFSFPIFLALCLPFLLTNSKIKKCVKEFITPSPLLARYLQQRNFNARAIPNFKKSQSTYSFQHIQPAHFLFAGALGSHKGIYILLTEFALALQQNHNLKLTIAGTGPEEKNMRKQCQTLGIAEHVEFVGWKKDLAALYATHVAFIFPSLWVESFGLVLTEAMHHGRAVIASNRGASPWIVNDNQTGLLFDPLVKGDLAEKILKIASDFKYACELGSNGFEKLKTFIDNDKILAEIISLYQRYANIT